MRVSVICTVLNEGDSIRRLLGSLAAQTRRPDRVVIVDGGSHDNTLAVIHEYDACLPLTALVAPGANIARGRNLAVEAVIAAAGPSGQEDIIASVDAGVWLEPQWLERLCAPLEAGAAHTSAVRPAAHQASDYSTNHPQSAAGFFVPDAATPFEVAMGATVLPALTDIDPATFLPSSRSVAFTAAAWEAAGRYPEWIDYCEDLIFDLRLRRRVGPFAWAPTAVAHFRPRGSLRAFFKQYYRYARGDGKADLWRMRHTVRYGTYLVALPALAFLGARRHPAWLLALLAGAAVYCRAPYRRLWPQLPALSTAGRLAAFALVPLIRVTGDVAKMLGYPAGWLWRLRNWRRPEIHWQE